jgi:excisionase family DNA binding protein
MTQTTDSPYLTVAEVAGMLGMTPDGVYKLIKRDKLPALRLSERGLRVTRWALEAYRDSLNGRGPDTRLPEDTFDLDALRTGFEEQTGMSPEDWVAAWKGDAVADTAENNSLLVQALALRELSSGDAEDWTVAALARRGAISQPRADLDRETQASHDVQAINGFIQDRLRVLDRDDVPAVEAACWLDNAGLLEDSESRPGLPLRNLLRDGHIAGADQRPAHRYGRWFITRS